MRFSVTAAGSTVLFLDYAAVPDAGSTPAAYRTIRLSGLTTTITFGQVVTVSYTDPTTGDDTAAVIQDLAGNDMASFTTGAGGVPAVVNTVPAPTLPTLVPTTWSLVPSGLGDGDSFRLLFITTSSTTASSSDITTYNTFVQDLVANNGHTDIRAHSATFRMLGSTEAVDARDNTGTTGTGVRIYWLNGAKAADDYADFYDGDWDEEAAAASETGALRTIASGLKIWTGSAHDGTEGMNSGGTESRALGNSGNDWVMQGSPNDSGSGNGPIQSNTEGRTTNRAVYGLSGVFTVDASLDNNAPEFPAGSTTREVAENSPAGTHVGDPVSATDADGDTLTYSLLDDSVFEIVASSGQLRTKAGVTYDYETQPVYGGAVTAHDGRGAATTVAVTINLLNVDEPPSAPAAPTVSAVAGSTTSLSVRWTAPDNDGKPDISSYDLQYRQGTTGSFGDGPQDETGTTATISGLAAGTAYQVQVRATNDEGDGGWSTAGSGATNASDPAVNQPPTVEVSADPTTVDGGGVVKIDGTATDPDGDDQALTFLWTASPDVGSFDNNTVLKVSYDAPRGAGVGADRHADRDGDGPGGRQRHGQRGGHGAGPAGGDPGGRPGRADGAVQQHERRGLDQQHQLGER